MRPTIDAERRPLILKCARLYSQDIKQPAIAERLKLTQSKVSRLIADAVKMGILVPQNPKFQEHLVSKEELAELDQSLSVDPDVLRCISDRFAALENFEVHMFPSGNRHEFGSAAAPTVAQLLTRSRCVGVSMGRTLAAIIDAIGTEARHRSLKWSSQLECVPVSGDCVFYSAHGDEPYSPSMLAGRLEDLLTGERNQKLPSLLGVPAYVASTFGTQVRNFVRKIPGYCEIFGPNPRGPFVDRLDTLLTGVGIIADDDEKMGVCIHERLKQEKGLTKSALNELVLGEITGYLIARKPKSRQSNRVNDLNEGWLGITGEKIEAIAKRSKLDGPPGVVLVAFGCAKATLVGTLVTQGWINHLVIDRELASVLAKGE